MAWAECEDCGSRFYRRGRSRVCPTCEHPDKSVVEIDYGDGSPPDVFIAPRIEVSDEKTVEVSVGGVCPECGRPYPMTNAERQKKYRERKRIAAAVA